RTAPSATPPRKKGTSNFRIHPAPGRFNPFLAVLLKVALYVPVLDSLVLTIELQGDENVYMAYYAPGQEADWCDEDEGDEGKRRV
ncbi:hypothetical protein J3E74DRAFT_383167, partial [Bipolaris maydis]